MCPDNNPYRTPARFSNHEVLAVRGSERFLRLACVLGMLSPGIALLIVYLCWGVACFSTGTLPRPSVDDPAEIGGLMIVAFPIALILKIMMVPLTLAGVVASFLFPFSNSSPMSPNRFLLVCLYVAACACIWTVVFCDPCRVHEWLID